jgi:hypothetical protein
MPDQVRHDNPVLKAAARIVGPCEALSTAGGRIVVAHVCWVGDSKQAQNGINHRKERMNATRLVGIALIVAGVLALAYGGFSYTKDTTAVKLGPIELSVKEKKTVNVPLWLGAGAIVVGGLLLVLGGRKS